MKTITLRSRITDDGRLRLDVPTGLGDGEVEVVIVVHPVSQHEPDTNRAKIPWPEFLEQTFGSIPDLKEIESEGDFEVREQLE